ncbi:MAG: GspE/PulE family protein [Candidatus Peribacteraceae bacterium]|jgi:type II secretory ATPase GspE/PulE/Tfp pilus assembly ATPase PilB-like protein|nr:GspE/PulE family protein [Candidatus Peribacteraceae bacterium]HCI03975.1 type II secretion system protein GspE [Candidatus Peribacteria bacterium]|tara:strand:- start:3831 stop:4925 length:1095 start_codon:yes stop_codon:yes gene_type:complete
MDWKSMDGSDLLDKLQQYSVEEGIADLHFSPEKTFVRLEVRLHGVLNKLDELEMKNYIELVRRVKFASKLKLNITNIPQDGQYTFEAPGRTVNIRVATIPSRFGETLTLRLLDPNKGIVPLEKLGFPKEIHESLDSLVKLPNGLILVTGPTGSGKTTTLYALLKCMAGKERNIITLENPIEYELPGIVQSQIDHEHDYTFANGLRSILRHDPDVILVGEIRDLETAQTAIDSALTGHLVLSTLHTNSAIEAIPRLLSMGVSPYTFAPSLRAILAQRLVRTLTDECKKDGADCDPMSHETYGGQMALPELLIITPELRELILLNETASTIKEQAQKEGYMTMSQWGEKLVNDKVTSMSEVMRVSI